MPKKNVSNVELENIRTNKAKKIAKVVNKAHGVTPKERMTNRTVNIAMLEPIHLQKQQKL